MALNLTELQQKADRVIHNADEVIRKWRDLTIAPPQDVTVEYYDPNGNLVRETIPNYRKQMANLLQDKRNIATYYAPAPITTEQELRDFINNIPYAGRGVGELAGNVVLTQDLIVGDGKHILLSVTTGSITFKAYTDPADGTVKIPRILIEDNSYVRLIVPGSNGVPPNPLFSIDFSAVDLVNSSVSTNILRTSLFVVVHSQLRFEYVSPKLTFASDTTLVDLSADPQFKLVVIARSALQLVSPWTDSAGTKRYGYIRLNSSAHQPFHVIATASSFYAGVRLADANGNDLYVDATGNRTPINWANHVGGVVRDANGVPRNIIAPYIL